jgi:hypothetical protein
MSPRNNILNENQRFEVFLLNQRNKKHSIQLKDEISPSKLSSQKY